VRLLASAEPGDVELARGEAEVTHRSDTLARIAAARCAAAADEAGDVPSALDLCLRYQLMSRHAHCVLVHPRADGETVDAEALLHRVSPMLAAGWGGMGSVQHLSAAKVEPRSPRMHRVHEPIDDDLFAGSDRAASSPRSTAMAGRPEPLPLAAIAFVVVEHLVRRGDELELEALDGRIGIHADLAPAWYGALALGASPAQVWLLLAHWVHQRRQGLGVREWFDTLRRRVDALEPQLVQRCMALFDRELAGVSIDQWAPSREERLQQAMRRAGA
jgi:hypothetical protein